MQLLLANSYFHWGTDHLLGFVFARTFGVLQYTFGQLAVGDLAGVLFIAGVVLLLIGKEGSRPQETVPGTAGSVSAAALRDQRRSRDCGPVSLRGNPALGLSDTFCRRRRQPGDRKLARGRLFPAVGVAVLIVAVCQAVRRATSPLHAPRRPAPKQHDSGHGCDPAESCSRRCDLCRFPDQLSAEVLPLSRDQLHRPAACRLQDFSCGGHRAISLGPETNVLTANLFPRRWDEMVRAYDLETRPDRLDFSGRMGHWTGA